MSTPALELARLLAEIAVQEYVSETAPAANDDQHQPDNDDDSD